MEGYKKCSKCNEVKPYEEFQRRKDSKDGYRSQCKECFNNHQRNYYNKNKEHIRERNKKYELDPIKQKERTKRYLENHKNDEDFKTRHRESERKRKEKRRSEAKQQIFKSISIKNNEQSYEQYGVIYGVYNIVTDRWYIGQTTNSFDIRYNGDFFKYKMKENLEDSNIKLLKNDFELYGEESFEIYEVIDIAFSEKELDEKEVYYIDYYESYDKGYNGNRGNLFKWTKREND